MAQILFHQMEQEPSKKRVLPSSTSLTINCLKILSSLTRFRGTSRSTGNRKEAKITFLATGNLQSLYP